MSNNDYLAIRSRTGALWQSRYHTKPVNLQSYLDQVILYIHLNPVAGGLNFITQELRTWRLKRSVRRSSAFLQARPPSHPQVGFFLQPVEEDAAFTGSHPDVKALRARKRLEERFLAPGFGVEKNARTAPLKRALVTIRSRFVRKHGTEPKSAPLR